MHGRKVHTLDQPIVRFGYGFMIRIDLASQTVKSIKN